MTMTMLQNQSLLSILPEGIIIVVALISLVLGAIKDNRFFPIQVWIAIAAFAAALLAECYLSNTPRILFDGMLIINSFVVTAKIGLLSLGLVIAWMSLSFYRNHKEYALNEFPVLLLLSVVGMMFMVSSNHLLSLFVSLELQGIIGYLFAAWHRHEDKSSEAGLKYFILGSLASGLLLFGMSFIYGYTGAANFSVIYTVVERFSHVHIGVLTGLIFIIIAIAIKLSAAPFHMWAPDVYQGAPTIVTTYFMVMPKLAMMALLARVLMEPFMPLFDQWQQIIIFLSIISMIVGAFGAIKQTNIKRLLAYSSIGHVGYMLISIATGHVIGIQALVVYLSIYLVTTLGMFAFVMMYASDERHEEIFSLAGFGKECPAMALCVAIFMLSLAGIPPLAGFLGKFYMFMAAIGMNLFWLAIIGVLSSVVAAYYYLRVIKIMYFDTNHSGHVLKCQSELKLVVFAAALFNIGLIFYHLPLLQLGENVSSVFFK